MDFKGRKLAVGIHGEKDHARHLLTRYDETKVANGVELKAQRGSVGNERVSGGCSCHNFEKIPNGGYSLVSVSCKSGQEKEKLPSAAMNR